MMKFIYYGIAILIVLWLGRKYLKGWILSMKEKKTPVKAISKDYIYVPLVSSRVFELSIEITEIGDGKATFSVVKGKKL